MEAFGNRTLREPVESPGFRAPNMFRKPWLHGVSGEKGLKLRVWEC